MKPAKLSTSVVNQQLRCEVCGRLRDHRDISVLVLRGCTHAVPFARNVAHCYDDGDCRVGAHILGVEFLASVEEPKR